MPNKRPLSPHIQIYKPQITSVMSILHRITGVVIFFGSLLFSLGLISASYSEQGFIFIQQMAVSWFGKVILFGITLALFYHFSNGVRHLFWDFGKGFDLKHVHFSGYLVIGFTALLSVATWFLVFIMTVES